MKRFSIIDKDYKTTQQLKIICEEYNLHYIEINTHSDDQILNQLLKFQPDLVFIDMDDTLENIKCFFLDILQYLPTLPIIIGMSTTKEKAFDAFQFEMSSFLLKPATELSIRKNIAKYQKEPDGTTGNIICLKSHKDYHYIPIDNILYLEADNNATDFYLSGGTKISAYKTLKTFEERLPINFLRIHKSYIINSFYVSRINYTKNRCSLNNLSRKIPFTTTFINNIDKINNSLSIRTQHVF